MWDKSRPIVYVSGPMTGVPDHNFPLFQKVTKALRDAGAFVINPAETGGGDKDLPWNRFMRLDISYLMASDAIVMLPGWSESRGAITEYVVAKAIGLRILAWEEEDVGEVAVELKANINRHWKW